MANVQAPAGAGRRKPLLLIAAAVLVVLVVAAIALTALVSNDPDNKAGPTPTATKSASQSPQPTAGSLASFSGSGNKTTEAFKAASNWEIRWRIKGGQPFAVELIGRNGASRGQIVEAKKRAHGSTFVSEAGEFNLKVTTSGDWSIQLIGRAPK